jgi:hypothetical protein
LKVQGDDFVGQGSPNRHEVAKVNASQKLRVGS